MIPWDCFCYTSIWVWVATLDVASVFLPVIFCSSERNIQPQSPTPCRKWATISDHFFPPRLRAAEGSKGDPLCTLLDYSLDKPENNRALCHAGSWRQVKPNSSMHIVHSMHLNLEINLLTPSVCFISFSFDRVFKYLVLYCYMCLNELNLWFALMLSEVYLLGWAIVLI